MRFELQAESELALEQLQDFDRGGGDLRADAVAREHHDFQRHGMANAAMTDLTGRL